MKKVAFILSATTILGAASVSADVGFCTTCKKVNAYNKENPQQYEYYEDYLKAVKAGEVTPKDPEKVLNEIRQRRVTTH